MTMSLSLLSEIEILKRKLVQEADRHRDLTHARVVQASQRLDKKLNEYERARRQSNRG